MLSAIHAASVNLVLAASGFDAKPNDSLPGGNLIQKIVGGLQTWGLYAGVAAIIAGAVYIAWGNTSHNPHSSSKGKMFVFGGIIGLMLIGGANEIGKAFFDMGKSIK